MSNYRKVPLDDIDQQINSDRCFSQGFIKPIRIENWPLIRRRL